MQAGNSDVRVSSPSFIVADKSLTSYGAASLSDKESTGETSAF